MPKTQGRLAFAVVLLDDAIDRPLDYAIPLSMEEKAIPGTRVLVPVRKSLRKATLLSRKASSEFENVQEIRELLSEKPLIPGPLFQLAIWMSHYYACPLTRIVRGLMPPSVREGMEEKTQLFVKLTKSKNQLAEITAEMQRKQPAGAAILETLLQSPKGMLLTQLLQQSGKSRSSISPLEKKGLITKEDAARKRKELLDKL